MSSKLGISFLDVPVGTVLARMDTTHLRKKAEGIRYMVIDTRLTDRPDDTVKGLLNLGKFNTVTNSVRAHEIWSKIPFQVLEATLTIVDPLLETN